VGVVEDEGDEEDEEEVVEEEAKKKKMNEEEAKKKKKKNEEDAKKNEEDAKKNEEDAAKKKAKKKSPASRSKTGEKDKVQAPSPSKLQKIKVLFAPNKFKNVPYNTTDTFGKLTQDHNLGGSLVIHVPPPSNKKDPIFYFHEPGGQHAPALFDNLFPPSL
jgi:hypothetical protein